MKRTTLMLTLLMGVSNACGGTGPESSEDPSQLGADEGDSTNRESGEASERGGATNPSGRNDDVIRDEPEGESGAPDEGAPDDGGESGTEDGESTKEPSDGGNNDPSDDSPPSDDSTSECASIDPADTGLCVCGDLRSKIVTGGPVGVNGRFETWNHVDSNVLWGDVRVAGAEMAADGNIMIRDGDLYTNGPVSTTDSLLVMGDARVGGDIGAWDVQIDGMLTQPAGNAVNATNDVMLGGTSEGPVSIAPPCDCANAIDVGSLVDQHQAQNDNAAAGVGGSLGASSELELPGGTYYVDAIQRSGDFKLLGLGDIDLYVAGNVDTENLILEMAAGTRSRIYIAGNVDVNHLEVWPGPGLGPSGTVDIYVGGTSVNAYWLSLGPTGASGELLAPNATITGTVRVNARRILAGEIDHDGIIGVHRDDECEE